MSKLNHYKLFDAIAEGVFILNREYEVVYWNKVLENWTGITRGEIFGKKITDYYSKLKKDQYKTRLDPIFDGGPPAIFSANLHKDFLTCDLPSGKPRIQHTTVTAIEGTKENEIYALISIVDVSALMQRLQDYKDANQKFEEEIVKRREIEDQLVKAKEEALIIARSKSEFLANMSHEIRTPLNAILGMGEILSEFDVGVEYAKYLSIQRNASKNLLNLINDILDLSKIDAGQMSLEEIPVNLKKCCESSLELLHFTANQRNTALKLDFSDDITEYYMADPNRLTQVFLNLVNNAIKFTSNGTVILRVGKDNKRNTKNLLIEVEDNGKGISKDKIGSIFSAFSQESKSTSRQYGGTGLGLTITKKLVDLMGGEIWVESELGEGTSFYVSIPLKVDEASHLLNKHIDEDKRTLLIVDDEKSVTESLEAILEDLDVNILFAKNGEEALRVLSENEVDAVVTDLAMPKLNGLELIQKAKEEKNLIPFIMISGETHQADLMRSLHLGLPNFFEKPLEDIDRFSDVVRSALDIGYKKRVLSKDKVTTDKVDAKKVLIAEDTLDNQDLMKAFLKGTPYKCTFVENGFEAYQTFINETKEGAPFDLVLMDIEMPECNGYESTKMIRMWEMDEGKKRTPIIALSAHSMQEEIEASIKSGCDDHLTKPISKSSLLKCIAESDKFSASKVKKVS